VPKKTKRRVREERNIDPRAKEKMKKTRRESTRRSDALLRDVMRSGAGHPEPLGGVVA
jgi:hypothetical protein